MFPVPWHRSVRPSISRKKYALSLRLFQVALFGYLLAIVACAPQSTPDLLQVDSVGPKTLEPGSEIQIIGRGFPENHEGTLYLEGMVYAPARVPKSVQWQLPLRAGSRGHITIRLSSRNLGTYLEGAPHLTFRGDALLEFAPLRAGRAILKGSKRTLVLDFFSRGEEENTDSSLFTQYLGIAVSPQLLITEVKSDARGAQAGLLKGDHLLELDGVRLDSLRDLLPQAQSRASVLTFMRSGLLKPQQVHLDRSEFQLLDHTVAARALVVSLGIVFAFLLAAHPPHFLLWLCADKTKGRRSPPLWLVDVQPHLQTLAYPVYLLVLLYTWWQLSGFNEQSVPTSLLVTLAAGGMLLISSAFLLGGASTHQRKFSLLGALSASLVRLLLLAPILLAVMIRISDVGSLHLNEVARSQGAFPHQWGMFSSPWTLFLSLSYLFSLVPIAGRRAPLEGNAGAKSPTNLLSRVGEWAGQLLLMGLWLALFGGATLGASSAGLGAGVLLSLKLALLISLVSLARARMGHLRVGESWGLFSGTQLLWAIIFAMMGFISNFSGYSDQYSELLGLLALAFSISLATIALVARSLSWSGMGRRVDPWI